VSPTEVAYWAPPSFWKARSKFDGGSDEIESISTQKAKFPDAPTPNKTPPASRSRQ
jgi:hypothetical protein